MTQGRGLHFLVRPTIFFPKRLFSNNCLSLLNATTERCARRHLVLSPYLQSGPNRPTNVGEAAMAPTVCT